MDIVVKSNRGEVVKAMEAQIAKALEMCGIQAEEYASDKLTKELNAVSESWYKRTGRLRNSIDHKVDNNEKTMYVGSDVEYAPYVEYGTGIYTTHEKGGRHTPWLYPGSDGQMHVTKGVKPKPFIKPAIAEHVEVYKRIIEDQLK